MATHRIAFEIEHLAEDSYLGTSPELPGLIVQAGTPEEVVRLAPEIARDLIEVMRAMGQPLPARLRPLKTPIARANGDSRVTYRELARKLESLVCEFKRQSKGSHEIWVNPRKNLSAVVPDHTAEIPKGTLSAVLKQLSIERNDFDAA